MVPWHVSGKYPVQGTYISMSDKYRARFEQITGGLTPEKFIEKIHSMPVDKAIETVKNNRQAFEYVKRMPKEREKFISDSQTSFVVIPEDMVMLQGQRTI